MLRLLRFAAMPEHGFEHAVGAAVVQQALDNFAHLAEQQPAETEAWYAPSMYNVVKQNGQDVHLVIKPDVNCEVNSGLGSVRGARMAENRRSDITGTQQQRLTEPMVWRYGTWQPTSWDDALDLVARVTARVIDKCG